MTRLRHANTFRLPAICRLFAPASLAVLLLLTRIAPCGAAEPAPRSRQFRFTYAGVVTGLRPGQAARVWLPVPPSDDEQTVAAGRRDLPAVPRVGREGKYGNEMLYFEAAAGADGSVPFSVAYRVTRREAGSTPAGKAKGDGGRDPVRADTRPADADLYLRPDARVPVGGRALTLLVGKPLPADPRLLARLLYDVVDDHLAYGKDKPGWGNGDAEWACESRSGNCTDFHSLFISLARAKGIPVKFEIGFPLPERRGRGEIPGYHCWAKFLAADADHAGGAWVPVDISEANRHPELRDYYFGHLTENRVTFSAGRDLVLDPKQDGPPLNYFVYPYAEVDGKPYPAEKVSKKFAYEDEEPGDK